jgi:catechol 2,3-dioxygenase-like lactoylglutathione lyase family enzyme
MESVIADLVKCFESGRLTRRDLVRALALLTVGGGTASAAGFHFNTINHVSALVSDMPRSVEFYGRVFGLSVVNEDKPNEIVRLGIGKTILLSLRHEKQNPPGVIDHFAFGVDGFNKEAITRELTAQGLTPQENIQYGFYVRDPDGVVVQLIQTEFGRG